MSRPSVHLVFGASGGIGSALVRRLSAGGARLVLAARDLGRLQALDVPGARCIECDATSFDEVDRCFAAAAEFAGEVDGGQIDGVACCVGSIVLKPAHLTSQDDWMDTIARNLTTAFAVVRGAAKTMRKGGSVVLCSSAAAAVGLPNHEAIAAAKGGIEALVRSAAASYAGRGLRFHAVAPGLVRTPLAASIIGNERALESSVRMHPLGRIGEPDDVAAAIEWLLDPARTWSTGDVIRVDGGLGQVRATPRA